MLRAKMKSRSFVVLMEIQLHCSFLSKNVCDFKEAYNNLFLVGVHALKSKFWTDDKFWFSSFFHAIVVSIT